MGALLDLALKARTGEAPQADQSGWLLNPAAEARQRAELRVLIDKLAETAGYFTEADKQEALEVAMRAPNEWIKYLPMLIEHHGGTVH